MNEAASITQPLVIQVEAPPMRGNALAETRKELENIELVLSAIHGRFSSLSKTPIVPIGFDQYVAKIRDLQKTGGVSNQPKPKELIEQFFPRKELRQAANDYLAEWKRVNATIEIEGKKTKSFRGASFATDKTAAAYLTSFNQYAQENTRSMQANFAQFISGRLKPNMAPGEVKVAAEGIQAILKEGEKLLLTVPTSRIRVELGEGYVKGGAAQVAASKRKGSAADGESGSATPASTASSKYRDEVNKLRAKLEAELKEAITHNPSTNRDATSRYFQGLAAGHQELLGTYGEKMGEPSTLREQARIEKYRRQAESNSKAAEAGRAKSAGSVIARAEAETEQLEADAAKTRERLNREIQKQIKADESRIERMVSRGIASSPTRHATTVHRANEARMAEERQALEVASKARIAAATGQQLSVAGAAGQEAFDAYLSQGYKVTGSRRARGVGSKGNQDVEIFTAEKTDGAEKFITTLTKVRENGRLVSVEIGNTAKAVTAASNDFVTNSIKVARWAASVALLYQPLRQLQGGVRTVIDMSQQMAQLDAVYNKVGGSTEALTGDVLALASAQGRNIKETVGVAKAWASLQMNREQIREATRVTLMQANVSGEEDASKSAEKLIEVYKAFNMQVGDLGTTLGLVTSLSKSFKLEQGAIMDGLARSAPIARQYKMSIGDLAGSVATVSRGMGLSGTAGGNAINGIATNLGNVDTQKALRQQFGVDLAPSGEIRAFSDMIAELYKRYEQLNKTQQDGMLMAAAGKTRFSRMAALMDHYVETQVMAINAQLHLNSAEEQSATIRASLKNQLQGLSTEFDKFVVQQGNNGPVLALRGMAEALKNVLKILNTGAGSVATSGFLALITVMGARLAITKVAIDAASGSSGYFSRTLQKMGEAAKSLSDHLQRLVSDFGKVGRAGQMNARVFQWGQSTFRSGRSNFQAGGMAPDGVGGRVAGMAQRGVGIGQMAAGGVAGLAAGSIAALGPIAVEVGVAIAATAAITWGFNRAMEAVGKSSEHNDRLLAEYSDRIAKFQLRAEAAAQAAKLFQTVTATLNGGASADRKRQSLDLLGDLDAPFKITPDERKAAEAAMSRGQTVDGALKSAQDRAVIEGVLSRQRAYEVAKEQQEAAVKEVARLKAAPFPNREVVARKEKEVAQLGLQKQQIQVELSSGAAAEDVAHADQKRLVVLTQIKVVSELIANTYASMAGVDPVTRFESETAAIKAQRSALEALLETEIDAENKATRTNPYQKAVADQSRTQAKSIRNEVSQDMAVNEARMRASARTGSDGPAPSGIDYASRLKEAERLEKEADTILKGNVPAATEARNRQAAIRPDLDRLKSEEAGRARPGVRDAVYSAAGISAAQKTAQNQFQAYGVGYSETEKILDRINKLEEYRTQRLRESADIQLSMQQRAEALAQATEAQKQIIEGINDAERRRNELGRQYAQMMKDREREFSHTLMTAGPDDLLKRLGVSQLARRGMTDARFMGMGAEGRRLLEEVPGYSAEARNMRREMNMSPQQRDKYRETQRQAEMIRGMGSVYNQQKSGVDALGDLLKFARQLNEVMVSGTKQLRHEFDGMIASVRAATRDIQKGHSGGHASIPQAGGYALGAS